MSMWGSGRCSMLCDNPPHAVGRTSICPAHRPCATSVAGPASTGRWLWRRVPCVGAGRGGVRNTCACAVCARAPSSARHCLTLCPSLSFSQLSLAHYDLHDARDHRWMPHTRARTTDQGSCRRVGHSSALMCASCFAWLRQCNFSRSVDWCICCVWRKNALSSLCKPSLLGAWGPPGSAFEQSSGTTPHGPGSQLMRGSGTLGVATGAHALCPQPSQ